MLMISNLFKWVTLCCNGSLLRRNQPLLRRAVKYKEPTVVLQIGVFLGEAGISNSKHDIPNKKQRRMRTVEGKYWEVTYISGGTYQGQGPVAMHGTRYRRTARTPDGYGTRRTIQYQSQPQFITA